MHYTHASSFGDCVGYTSIPWAHYGSLESSGVDLAPKKIQFYKNLFLTGKNLFLDHRPGSKSLLPWGCNQGGPQGLKSVWYTSFGPYRSQDLYGANNQAGFTH